MRSYTWSNEDPRLTVTRGEIIVLTRVPHGWCAHPAIVETKHGYSITFLHHNPEAAAHAGFAKILDADDAWDQDWCWIHAPEVTT